MDSAVYGRGVPHVTGVEVGDVAVDDEAQLAGDAAAAEAAGTEAARHAADLARLAVADAARREWREATVTQEAAALEARAELQRRGLTERTPVTDTEVAETSAEPRGTPPMDPAAWAAMKAEQTARVHAERQAEAERMARLTPVTDAEIERYGSEPDPAAERSASLAGLREDIGALGAKVDELAQQEAERAADRAQITQAAIDEPSVREPQVEAALEPSWQPGDSQGHYEPQAGQEADTEMEIG